VRESLESRRARYSNATSIVTVVGLVGLFVLFVAERLWLDVGIVAVVGLALGLFFLWTSKVVRAVDELLEQIPDAPVGEPSDAMLAVDAFDDAIREAPGVPFTDQVRLDRQQVGALLDRLRTTLRFGSSELTDLEELIRRAKPIPLSDEIRLDREKVYDVLDRMRASFAENR
jgi:hypothetical protein